MEKESHKSIKMLEGKIVHSVVFPEIIEIEGRNYYDDNILIRFKDGSELRLASWDYEGYSSGIYKEIILP